MNTRINRYLKYMVAGFVVGGPVAYADSSNEPVTSYVATVPYFLGADNDRGTDDGVGIQLTYGRLFSGNWYLEGTLAAANLETDVDGGTDFYQASIGMDLVYRFDNLYRFTPFVLAGGGALYDDVFPDSQDSTNFYANAGAGFVSGELGRTGMRLRGEARYVYDDFRGGMGDWRAGLGIEVPLGQSKVITREVRIEVPVVREVIKEVPVPQADSDNDGVVDGVDRCPNTLAGARVDQYGCVVKKQTLRLEGVHFEFNSAQLTTESLAVLENVALSLTSQANLNVEIAGHTDSVGSEQYNRSLSQARAESVRNFLVSRNVSPSRMKAVGYGESQPSVSNDTKQGRALNRRVEFRVLGE